MEITIWSRGLETQQYKKLEKTFEDWMAMNDDEREAHWKKFLNYCFDDDKKTVTATNKKLTVPINKGVGGKRNQRSGARSHRTTPRGRGRGRSGGRNRGGRGSKTEAGNRRRRSGDLKPFSKMLDKAKKVEDEKKESEAQVTDDEKQTMEEGEKASKASSPKESELGNEKKKKEGKGKKKNPYETSPEESDEDRWNDSEETNTDNISEGSECDRSHISESIDYDRIHSEDTRDEMSNGSDKETSEYVQLDDGKEENNGKPTRSTKGTLPTRYQTSYDMGDDGTEGQGMNIMLL